MCCGCCKMFLSLMIWNWFVVFMFIGLFLMFWYVICFYLIWVFSELFLGRCCIGCMVSWWCSVLRNWWFFLFSLVVIIVNMVCC